MNTVSVHGEIGGHIPLKVIGGVSVASLGSQIRWVLVLAYRQVLLLRVGSESARGSLCR